MSGHRVPQWLALVALISTATSIRTGRAVLGVLGRRGGRVVRLSIEASVGGAAADDAAQSLRDELVGTMREVAEVQWHQLRRAVDEFDSLTRDGDTTSSTRRVHRVKR